MIRRKKQLYKILVVSVFVGLFFFLSIESFNDPSLLSNNLENSNSSSDKNKNLPFSSNPALNITNSIIGNGNNQTTRVYLINASSSKNNIGYFNISTPLNNINLTYGDFNFTFMNNFTTEYVIENDDALNSPSNFISFPLNVINSQLKNYTGLKPIVSNLNKIFDNDNSTYLNLTSSNGILNFSLCANFSKIISSSLVKTEFNRTKILGLLLSSIFKISLDANLTIKIWDTDKKSWINVTNVIQLNKSKPGFQVINKRIVNENLKYINASDVSCVQFYFNRTDTALFNVSLYKLHLNSTLAFDLPITNNTYVALEFDLRGQKSTINGFYAWIRTLNLTKAVNSELNISLYRANTSIVRTSDKLRANSLRLANYLGSFLIHSYNNDSSIYFSFKSINSVNLSLGNYFIVIKSNRSEMIYSLVGLPYNNITHNYGDATTEHQLKITNNKGVTWFNAIKNIATIPTGVYLSKQLDASSFKLNVTRGYIPSDFNSMLKIQNHTIINQTINSFPYNGSLVKVTEWGKGRWNYNFTPYLQNNQYNVFFINLTGYKTHTQDLIFNVSYLVKAYHFENATSNYSATYDSTPRWTLNYTLGLNKYRNWNFTEFWYIFPSYWNARNLTTPNPEDKDVFSKTGGSSIFSENLLYKKVIVSKNIVNVSNPLKYNGSYLLNLSSFNCIYDTHGYINFNGTLWETRGFMFGDNISVSVDVQDQRGFAPNSGNANASLFYPNGTKFSDVMLTSISGKRISNNHILSYDFGNQTILNLTSLIKVQGKYYIGYFWTNGTAIGCKKMEIYIDSYKLNILNCVYYPDQNFNVLEGTIAKVSNLYTMLIASVNETTGTYRPNFYSIDNQSINKEFSYVLDSEEFKVILKSFKQNETILNPNEIINSKISFQNKHEISDLSVKVNVKLVSLANEEWIIAENSSKSMVLKYSGHPNDTKEFDVNLKIPSIDIGTKIWKGLNAPMRLAGARTIVTVYIENNNAGSYDNNEYSLLINETEDIFEGHILALKRSDQISSSTITKVFQRVECMYRPKNSTFITNIYDQHYMSSYSPYIKKFNNLKLDSEFRNITINPEDPVYGQSIELSSVLTTEFGVRIRDKEVICEYKKDGLWTSFTPSIKTNLNGSTTFTIDTTAIVVEEDLFLRLSWLGNDTILKTDQIIPIKISFPFNQISISFSEGDNPVIYRNANYSLKFALSNTGNSTLKVLSVSLKIDGNLKYSIKEVNYLLLNQFKPGQTTDIIVEIELTNVEFKILNITVSITGQNIISTERMTVKSKISLQVLDYPILNFIVGIFIFIALSIIALIWVLAYFYAKKTIKKIEMPIEVRVKKEPVKGKYVKVSELEAEIKEKEIETPEVAEELPPVKEIEEIETEGAIEKEVSIPKKKKTVDLDELLQEEVIEEEKEVPTKKKLKEIKEQKILEKKIEKKKKQDLKLKKKEEKIKEVTEKALPSKTKAELKVSKEKIELEKFKDWSLKRLRNYCRENNIKLPSKILTRSDIIRLIEKSLAKKKPKEKSTDFDSLLKEKGLNDKDKK